MTGSGDQHRFAASLLPLYDATATAPLTTVVSRSWVASEMG